MSQPSAAGPRTGFIAIVGRPNVGKSTLLNALVGEKVSITSRKPQTTRQAVRGVLTRGTAQFIFVDTPGLQRRYRSELNRRMNESIRSALAGVDAIVFVIEAHGWKAEDDAVMAALPRPEGPARVVLAINKIDLLTNRDALLPLIAQCAQRYPFAAIVPVSAENLHQPGSRAGGLLDELEKLLPEGEPLFDTDAYTDRSTRFLAAEIVREKAFRLLGDELPYGVAVTIDQWREEPSRASIAVTMLVERDSHKGIVIGAGGAKLREIGRLARSDIEQLLNKPVFIETHVRVRRGWSDRASDLKTLGYE